MGAISFWNIRVQSGLVLRARRINLMIVSRSLTISLKSVSAARVQSNVTRLRGEQMKYEQVNKFRGLTPNSGWVYGNLTVLKKSIHPAPGTYISNEYGAPFAYIVRPETVGQFIRLHDKDGTEIYDGDRVDTPHNKGLMVSWNVKYASFCLNKDGWMFQHWFGEAVEPEHWVLVGNIHEAST